MADEPKGRLEAPISTEALAMQLARNRETQPGGTKPPQPKTPAPEPKPEEIEAPPDGSPEAPDLSQLPPEEQPPDPAAPENPDELPPEDTTDDELPPELKEKVDRRIGKEVAKRKTAEEALEAVNQQLAESTARVTELETENEELRSAPPEQTPGKASAPEQQMEAAIAEKRAILRWVEENPDGAEMDDGKGGTRTFTAEEVRTIKERTSEDLSDLRRDLRDFQRNMAQQTNQLRAQAHTEFPWLKVKTSPEYSKAQTIFNQYPWLRNVPGADLAIGRLVEYDSLKAQVAKLTAKPAAPKPPTPPPTRLPTKPGAAAPKPTAPETKVKAAEENLRKTGTVASLAQSFAAKRQ